jgi:hypothetical protein
LAVEIKNVARRIVEAIIAFTSLIVYRKSYQKQRRITYFRQNEKNFMDILHKQMLQNRKNY